jgi:hypothetical protein
VPEGVEGTSLGASLVTAECVGAGTV